MAALRLPVESNDQMEFLPAAGLPWFVALFGRDTLITSLQTHDLASGLCARHPVRARGVAGDRARRLPGCGARQDPARAAARASSPRCNLIPHTPYYGTADATPLYLMTLHAAWRATGDLELVRGASADRRRLPGLDRRIRRPRQGRVPGIRDALGRGLRERRLEGFRRSGRQPRRDAGPGPEGAVRAAGLRLCRLARHGGDLPALGDAVACGAADAQRRTRFHAVQRGVLGRGDGLLRLLPGRHKAPVWTVASNPGHWLWSGSCRRTGPSASSTV